MAGRAPGRERSRDGGDDRRAEQHERGAVVDEALALDDVDQPPGHTEPPADRGGGGRIGRRDDRAQDERLRPAEVRDRVRDERDPDHGQDDEPEGEQRDRSQVPAQLAQAGAERGVVEERRQDADEHDLRRHRHLRHAWPEGEQEPAEDEQDRVGDPQRPGEHEQHRARDEQHEQLELLPGPELCDQHPDTIAKRAPWPLNPGAILADRLTRACRRSSAGRAHHS